jgi:hypothetical protein
MEKVDLKNESEPLNKHLVTCRCMVCGEEFKGEEPEMCCSGRDCGCMGVPIDPIICSEECYNKLPFRNGR